MFIDSIRQDFSISSSTLGMSMKTRYVKAQKMQRRKILYKKPKTMYKKKKKKNTKKQV